MARGGVGVGVDIQVWGGGVVVQHRESPDFRSPEVGRYVVAVPVSTNRCVACCLLSCPTSLFKSHVTFRILP